VRRCALMVVVSRSRVAAMALGLLALAVASGPQAIPAAATVRAGQMSSASRISASGKHRAVTASMAASSAKACSDETVDAGGQAGKLRLRFKLIGRVSCAKAHRLVRTYFHKMATGGCGQLNNFCLLSFPGGWSCSIFSAGESQQAGGAMAGCARTGAKIRLFKARRTRSARTNASFRSPSRNISCEMTDDPRGSSPHVYCQSFAKPHSVLMDVTGRLKICRGRLCLGDPGEHTPVLRYGKRVQVGRFTCRSRRSGVSCAVTKTGMGFLIDRDRVERLRP
jgi:hypothetical protein